MTLVDDRDEITNIKVTSSNIKEVIKRLEDIVEDTDDSECFGRSDIFSDKKYLNIKKLKDA